MLPRRLQTGFVTSDAGHHGPIVAIRVQALGGFAQSGVDCRIARITFGGKRHTKLAGMSEPKMSPQ
jgi:hypothetical protein